MLVDRVKTPPTSSVSPSTARTSREGEASLPSDAQLLTSSTSGSNIEIQTGRATTNMRLKLSLIH